MSYFAVFMKILIISLIGSLFLGTSAEFYLPKITDNIVSCANFDNKVLDCSGLKLGSSSDGGEAKLSGKIITNKELTDGVDIELDVIKILDLGEEYMYNIHNNFCNSLHNTDTPWYPIIEKLGISKCPVAPGEFLIQDGSVSLAAVSDVMTHNFVGSYNAIMSFINGTESISCHVIELSIVEVNEDEEKK